MVYDTFRMEGVKYFRPTTAVVKRRWSRRRRRSLGTRVHWYISIYREVGEKAEETKKWMGDESGRTKQSGKHMRRYESGLMAAATPWIRKKHEAATAAESDTISEPMGTDRRSLSSRISFSFVSFETLHLFDYSAFEVLPTPPARRSVRVQHF